MSDVSALRGRVLDAVRDLASREVGVRDDLTPAIVERSWVAFRVRCELGWRQQSALLGVAASSEDTPGSCTVFVLRAGGVSGVVSLDPVQVCACCSFVLEPPPVHHTTSIVNTPSL